MDINTVMTNFNRAYPSRNAVQISSSSDGIYVIDAPEKNAAVQETSNMFIGNGIKFVPFNPINDLDAYVSLMGKVKQVWPQQVMLHSGTRRWR